MANDEIEQIYDEYEKQQSSTTKKIVTGLEPRQMLIFIFIGIAIIIAYMSKIFEKNTLLIIVIATLIIFAYMLSKQTDPGSYIDIRQARSILDNELKYLQKNHILPQGKIKIDATFQLQSIEGNPSKHIIAFTMLKRDGGEETYAGEVKAIGTYAGKITGIKRYPEGITGRELKDIMYLETREQKWARTYGWDKRARLRQ